MNTYQTAATRSRASTGGSGPKKASHEKLRRWAGMTLLGLAVVIAGVLMVRGIRAHRHAQLVAALKSAAMNQDREPLQAAMSAGTISKDEGRSLMRDAWASRQQKQMDDYFALPPGPARTQAMDKLIEEREARRKEREARRLAQGAPADSSGPGGAGPGGPNPASRAARVESVPPASRAQRQQFRYDMNQQLAARGMPAMQGR
ncbi:MAG TPA: hypothetical protein VG269_22260 [Tepidisphaeraceae bacterium]|jgi:hypothetical protein|nr:hypothetical protein [Tepidisphaeraceae bacterium]